MLSLAKLSSPYISYGVLSLFILTELNSNFAATDMKSQAYAPIWPNGPCLPWLQQGRDCFASGSHGVSGTQTFFGLRMRIYPRQSKCKYFSLFMSICIQLNINI